ncbi:MAG: family 1 glycosylhydrolase [Candidatus Eremiobacteraeota bacterium]|nr:family 1 glycosylhydrolase [Candidatus Eremiobacteraeota bacterium]
MSDSMHFGVATADHQCEAYDGNDDIRDLWERSRGLTERGNATDFWNRYREDIDLAKGLGCTIFRLSLSWARLEPEPGRWSDEGFAHYRELLEYLRAAGMQAVVTLHHNTWPLHVQAAGDGAGLLDTGFPDLMAGYAQQVAHRLGDLIDYYVTLNEPNQLVYGFIKGFWMRAYPMPPGQPPDTIPEAQMDAVLRLIPNLLLAHARSRAAIRAIVPNAKVGANPLVLGLPGWLQKLVDRGATHAKSPEQLRKHASRIVQASIVENGRVDCSVAQVAITHERMEQVLFSEPYFATHAAALHPKSAELPASLANWKATIGVLKSSEASESVGARFPDATVLYFADLTAGLAALRAGSIALLYSDEALVAPYANGELAIARLPGYARHYAVAVPPGHHALLDAIDRAIERLRSQHPEMPHAHGRATVHHIGRTALVAPPDPQRAIGASVVQIRKRGKMRIGIHPGVPGLCEADGKGGYRGLEIDLAHAIAREVLQSDTPRIEFVALGQSERISATRSWLQIFDKWRRTLAMFGTLIGTNWWNLAMLGALPEFLCPRECVGTLDFVGLDYYWGVPSIRPGELQRLGAAAECRYAQAPVWPGELERILRQAHEQFPDKPIVVIENGCVTSADGFSRAAYLAAHVAEVDRAIAAGVPVEAYLCWSITSNREWGLPFDDNSDFGLYHIDLDNDPALKRTPTEASARYAEIIAKHRTTE